MTEPVDPQLMQIVIDRQFVGSHLRINCAPDDMDRVQYNSQTFLKKLIMSDVVKDGEMYDLCKTTFPWCEQVT